jgi:hypothetical protein
MGEKSKKKKKIALKEKEKRKICLEQEKPDN